MHISLNIQDGQQKQRKIIFLQYLYYEPLENSDFGVKLQVYRVKEYIGDIYLALALTILVL